MRAPGSTLKVARDDPKRPELEVHAFQWVIYDPEAVEGVRPLRLDDLKDLVDKGWLDPSDLTIPLDASWPHWVMNVADLDPSVPPIAIPERWNGLTAGEVKQLLERDGVTAEALESIKARVHVDDWLNWRTWTVDELQAQLNKPEVRSILEDKQAM